MIGPPPGTGKSAVLPTLMCGSSEALTPWAAGHQEEADITVGLQVAQAAVDYLHLYNVDSTALGASLDRIQRAASVILAAVGSGG